jgi:hypothetical protein
MNVRIVVLYWIEIRMRRSTFCARASNIFSYNRMSVGLHTQKLSFLGDRAVTRPVNKLCFV